MSDPADIRRAAVLTQQKIRSAFLTVFQGDDGAIVLSTIGKRCGIEQTTTEGVDPALTAFWNWLMVMLGVRHEDPNENLTVPEHYQDYIDEAKVILSIANMRDVDKQLSEIGGEKDADT